MREFFREKAFRPASRALISKCRIIVTEYQQQGLRLTLRQLYYQLVSQNVIPNLEKSYKSLGALVSDARLAGLIDWDAIEDRVRVPRVNAEFDNLADLVNIALHAYRLPRWRDAENYVELRVEKDALAGVLAPIASEYHVTMMVNRGYSSQSAMYESAKRFKEREDKSSFLFYLGDHDPSGEDMVRDIEERMIMFGVRVEVRKLALTIEQIDEYNPPPNPAKLSDSRAPGYIAKHGASSWEVDALPPQILSSIIRTALDEVTDEDEIDRIKKREAEDKKRLQEMVQGI